MLLIFFGILLLFLSILLVFVNGAILGIPLFFLSIFLLVHAKRKISGKESPILQSFLIQSAPKPSPVSSKKTPALKTVPKLNPKPASSQIPPAPPSVPEANHSRGAFHANGVCFPDYLPSGGISYKYLDVEIIPVAYGHLMVKPDTPLEFSIDDDAITIHQENRIIGLLNNNRLSEMVKDWKKTCRDIVSYPVSYAENDSHAVIAIAFYDDLIEKFIKSHEKNKQCRLTGKTDYLAPSVAYGQPCTIDYDYEKEKYSVEIYPYSIGYLPSSAIRFCEDNSISPDDLDIILTDVDDSGEITKYSVCIGI